MVTKKESSNEEKVVYSITGKELLDKVRELVKEGRTRRIIIKNEKGESVLEVNLSVALIGTILAPLLAAIGALAVILTKCTLEVVKKKQ